jgi:hypothetical protein
LTYLLIFDLVKDSNEQLLENLILDGLVYLVEKAILQTDFFDKSFAPHFEVQSKNLSRYFIFGLKDRVIELLVALFEEVPKQMSPYSDGVDFQCLRVLANFYKKIKYFVTFSIAQNRPFPEQLGDTCLGLRVLLLQVRKLVCLHIDIDLLVHLPFVVIIKSLGLLPAILVTTELPYLPSSVNDL